MSGSIFKLIKKLNSPEDLFGLVVFGFANGLYVYNTMNTKSIRVVDKFQYTTLGWTRFMVVDSDNNHYDYTNTIWFNKWDSIEKWHQIKPNSDVNIKMYGYRLPMFGIFPKIYESQEL